MGPNLGGVREAALIISGERRESYEEMELRIRRSAAAIASLELANGAPVALMLRNDFAFFELSYAAASAGAPVVPINWHLKADEVAYILRDSGAEALFCHTDLLDQIRAAIPHNVRVFVLPTPPEIAMAFGVDEERTRTPNGWLDWEHRRDGYEPASPFSGGPNTVLYTSGTTGRPKGVRRRPMAPDELAALDRVSSLTYGIRAGTEQVVLLNGPMYHFAPNSYGLLAFRQRRTIIMQARFDAEDLLRLIERHKVTHIHMVPTMFVRLLRLPPEIRARYDVSSLRFVVHGAAPCPIAVKQAMIAWWGPVIHEYFGSTETGIPIWHSAEEALRKPGTIGRVTEGGVVRVVRPDGSACDPGEPGEIFMRQMALADFDYHGLPEARAEAGLDALVSVGDIGYFDSDGYLFLCDRKRDMVISGGVNIYPVEIEGVLIGLEGVHDCAVFGVPDDEYGERLVACIEPDKQATLSPVSVQTFLKERLAHFKSPREVYFVPSLPREATGKIFKRKLRDAILATGAPFS